MIFRECRSTTISIAQTNKCSLQKMSGNKQRSGVLKYVMGKHNKVQSYITNTQQQKSMFPGCSETSGRSSGNEVTPVRAQPPVIHHPRMKAFSKHRATMSCFALFSCVVCIMRFAYYICVLYRMMLCAICYSLSYTSGGHNRKSGPAGARPGEARQCGTVRSRMQRRQP